ncbi:MAG: hypothetical protein QXW70_00930 [Candidatus Anstonellales archaeon]
MLELPEGVDLNPTEDVEFFHLKGGFYLLSISAFEESKKETSSTQLSPIELAVIYKLSKIKFENRTPSVVSKILSSEEKKVLSSLLEKRAVWLFKKGKYSKEGVYNISETAYRLGTDSQPQPEDTSEKKEFLPPILGGKEYAILEASEIERLQDNQMRELIKRGDLLGTIGFDKRLYLATRTFYEIHSPIFINSLSSAPKTVEQLSQDLHLNQDACRVMLAFLSEKGEILEKKKGFYQVV